MRPGKKQQMVQCGREVSAEEIAEIQDTVKTFYRLSRSELAKTICEHLEWSTASGKHKVDACMKLLEKLETQGVLKLPDKEESGNKKVNKPSHTERTEPGREVVGGLKEVGAVRLKAVQDGKDGGLWNEFMDRYHYLGYSKPFGCHLRYFIESERGLLGCLLFAGAAKSIGVRDRWIGWTEAQRLRNLGWVVNNSRFLVFPWVQVKCLASHVLGQVGRRIRDDWLERWEYAPVLMETFVDPRLYAGTCYRAANWQYLGMTTGEGLVRKGKSYTTTPKQMLVRPLVEDFRAVLCS